MNPEPLTSWRQSMNAGAPESTRPSPSPTVATCVSNGTPTARPTVFTGATPGHQRVFYETRAMVRRRLRNP
jgi:hypothetical protein